MPPLTFAPVLAAPSPLSHTTRSAQSPRQPLHALPPTSFFGTRRVATPSSNNTAAPAPLPLPRPSTRAPAMSLEKVVIAGGTGFVGSRLAAALVAKGASVTVLTRYAASATALPAGVTAQVWAPDNLAAVGNDWLGWQSALANADLVVNLAGQPIVSRWDAAGKRSIVNSRISSTSSIAKAIASLPPADRPRCLVSASAVGYYGVSAAAVYDENSSPAPGDFLSDLCVQWEKAATEGLQAVPETRLVIMRIGVVMGVGGGALAKMLPAFQLFVGGPVGSGQQWVSWVHIDDLVRIIIRAGEDESMRGVYNATAPKPVTMGRLAESLAGALGRPNLFPVPGFVLKLAFGEGAMVVLEGNKVLPKRILDSGFQFEHADIDSAMKAVAKET